MEDNLLTDLKKLQSAFDGLVLKGGGLNTLFRGITKGLTLMVNILSGEVIQTGIKKVVSKQSLTEAKGILNALDPTDNVKALKQLGSIMALIQKRVEEGGKFGAQTQKWIGVLEVLTDRYNKLASAAKIVHRS